MRKEYDFSNAIKNPYFHKLDQQATIRLEQDVFHYFQNLARERGISYQALINLYLRECVVNRRDPVVNGVEPTPAEAWWQKVDALSADILTHRAGRPVDVDALIQANDDLFDA